MKRLTATALPTSLMNILGLCYFDPVTEKLVEFNSDETIHLTPYENTVRRYYLVVTSDLYNGTKLRYSTLSFNSPSEDIEVRVQEGTEVIHDKYSFDDIEINTTLTVFFNNHPSGIIPLDINIKSLSSEARMYHLDISVTAGG